MLRCWRVSDLTADIGLAARAASLNDAERAQICAEAADRYRQMAGKAPGEELFVVVLVPRDVYCPMR
ncbi:MAG: hypothetical protein U1E97_08115 [Alphaproteobacteria bacterium]